MTFENDKLNHLEDMYGDKLDLSDGYRDNHSKIPLTFLKAYQNNPLINELIDDLKYGVISRNSLINIDQNKEIACKFCNTNKFMLKYGQYEILASCPNCGWMTSAYSG